MSMSGNPKTPEFVAVIGIDWADQHNDISLRVVGNAATQRKRIGATPEALNEWIGTLRERFDGPVGICLEQSRGALIHALLEHDFLVLYPINPSTLDQFRKAFSSSRAKSDSADADLLRELLEKHAEHLHAWQPDDSRTRELGRLVEARRKAVDHRTRLVQQMGAELKGYFPQAIELAGRDLASPMACDFLQRWPRLDALKRVHAKTVRRFYTTHHCRSEEIIERRLEQIRTALPLVTDEAIIGPAAMTVTLLAAEIGVLNKGITAFDKRISELFDEHPDAHLFSALPGSGAVLAPRLLAAFGTDRRRYEKAVNIQQYSGIAPVTEASGKSRWVHWRWSAPTFVRQTFHEFAGRSIHHSVWARTYYDQMRARGKSHHAAIRSLAFKWIRIIWRCWMDKTQYDETRYLEALRERGSHLAAAA